MSTALSYSKYYLEQEEVKIYNASAASKKLSKLVQEYNQAQDIEDRKIKGQGIIHLKVNVFEERIALLEGGIEALAVKSFSEARRLVLKTLAGPGDNIITINSTSLLFDSKITKGENIEVRNAYNSSLSAFLDENSKAIYLETVASDGSIPDFLKISAFAKSAGIPLIVDNTQGVAGYVSTPLKNGADLIIANTSELFKTFDHVIGAVIVDGGTFDWENEKFPKFRTGSRPNPIAPQSSSFLNVLRNIYSFHLQDRIMSAGIHQFMDEVDALPFLLKEQSSTSLQLAKWLKGSAFIKNVNYAGLPDNRNYFQALKYFKNSFGNKLSFSLFSDEDTARQFVNILRNRIPEDNNGNKNYRVTFNPTDLSIEVLITSGLPTNIIGDFRFALEEVYEPARSF